MNLRRFQYTCHRTRNSRFSCSTSEHIRASPGVQVLYGISDVGGVFLTGGSSVAPSRPARSTTSSDTFAARGGGMVRDGLVQQGTAAAMVSREYLLLAFSATLTVCLFPFRERMWRRVEADADAVITGALIWGIFHYADLQPIAIIMGAVAGAGLPTAAHRFGWELRTGPDFTPASRTSRQLRPMIEMVGKKDSHENDPKPGGGGPGAGSHRAGNTAHV